MSTTYLYVAYRETGAPAFKVKVTPLDDEDKPWAGVEPKNTFRKGTVSFSGLAGKDVKFLLERPDVAIPYKQTTGIYPIPENGRDHVYFDKFDYVIKCRIDVTLSQGDFICANQPFKLFSHKGKFNQEGVTDENGKFTFMDKPIDSWYLEVENLAGDKFRSKLFITEEERPTVFSFDNIPFATLTMNVRSLDEEGVDGTYKCVDWDTRKIVYAEGIMDGGLACDAKVPKRKMALVFTRTADNKEWTYPDTYLSDFGSNLQCITDGFPINTTYGSVDVSVYQKLGEDTYGFNAEGECVIAVASTGKERYKGQPKAGHVITPIVVGKYIATYSIENKSFKSVVFTVIKDETAKTDVLVQNCDCHVVAKDLRGNVIKGSFGITQVGHTATEDYEGDNTIKTFREAGDIKVTRKLDNVSVTRNIPLITFDHHLSIHDFPLVTGIVDIHLYQKITEVFDLHKIGIVTIYKEDNEVVATTEPINGHAILHLSIYDKYHGKYTLDGEDYTIAPFTVAFGEPLNIDKPIPAYTIDLTVRDVRKKGIVGTYAITQEQNIVKDVPFDTQKVIQIFRRSVDITITRAIDKHSVVFSRVEPKPKEVIVYETFPLVECAVHSTIRDCWGGIPTSDYGMTIYLELKNDLNTYSDTYDKKLGETINNHVWEGTYDFKVYTYDGGKPFVFETGTVSIVPDKLNEMPFTRIASTHISMMVSCPAGRQKHRFKVVVKLLGGTLMHEYEAEVENFHDRIILPDAECIAWQNVSPRLLCNVTLVDVTENDEIIMTWKSVTLVNKIPRVFLEPNKGSVWVTCICKDDAPAKGAVVKCVDKQDVADEKGVAHLYNVPIGEQEISITYLGVEVKIKAVMEEHKTTLVTFNRLSGRKIKVKISCLYASNDYKDRPMKGAKLHGKNKYEDNTFDVDEKGWLVVEGDADREGYDVWLTHFDYTSQITHFNALEDINFSYTTIAPTIKVWAHYEDNRPAAGVSGNLIDFLGISRPFKTSEEGFSTFEICYGDWKADTDLNGEKFHTEGKLLYSTKEIMTGRHKLGTYILVVNTTYDDPITLPAGVPFRVLDKTNNIDVVIPTDTKGQVIVTKLICTDKMEITTSSTEYYMGDWKGLKAINNQTITETKTATYHVGDLALTVEDAYKFNIFKLADSSLDVNVSYNGQDWHKKLPIAKNTETYHTLVPTDLLAKFTWRVPSDPKIKDKIALHPIKKDEEAIIKFISCMCSVSSIFSYNVPDLKLALIGKTESGKELFNGRYTSSGLLYQIPETQMVAHDGAHHNVAVKFCVVDVDSGLILYEFPLQYATDGVPIKVDIPAYDEGTIVGALTYKNHPDWSVSYSRIDLWKFGRIMYTVDTGPNNTYSLNAREGLYDKLVVSKSGWEFAVSNVTVIAKQIQTINFNNFPDDIPVRIVTKYVNGKPAPYVDIECFTPHGSYKKWTDSKGIWDTKLPLLSTNIKCTLKSGEEHYIGPCEVKYPNSTFECKDFILGAIDVQMKCMGEIPWKPFNVWCRSLNAGFESKMAHDKGKIHWENLSPSDDYVLFVEGGEDNEFKGVQDDIVVWGSKPYTKDFNIELKTYKLPIDFKDYKKDYPTLLPMVIKAVHKENNISRPLKDIVVPIGSKIYDALLPNGEVEVLLTDTANIPITRLVRWRVYHENSYPKYWEKLLYTDIRCTYKEIDDRDSPLLWGVIDGTTTSVFTSSMIETSHGIWELPKDTFIKAYFEKKYSIKVRFFISLEGQEHVNLGAQTIDALHSVVVKN